MTNQNINDVDTITTFDSTDRILVNTDVVNNVLEQIEKDDFIADIISADSNNLVEIGTDNKIFATDTTNADNITSGTLSSNRLSTSGVTAGSYTNVDLTVDTKGRITAISSGGVSYTQFSINKGYIDSNGDSDIISYSSGTLSFKVDDGTAYAPLVATPANSQPTFTRTSIPDLDMSGYDDGTYNVFVGETGNAEAYANTIYVQTDEPVPEATFTQPTLSSNGTLGGSSFAVTCTNNTTNAWKPFASQLYQSTASPGTVDFIAFNPTALHVSSITIKGNGEAPYYPSAFTIYGSNDNSAWTSLGSYTNSNYSEKTIAINSYTGFYKYHKISITSFAYYDGYPYLFVGKLVLNGTKIASNNNNVWFDTSAEPLKSYKYSGSVWAEYNKVPIGSATVASGVITSVENVPFNYNGYNFVLTPENVEVVRKYLEYDFTAGVSKSTSGFTADKQGLCVFKSVNSIYGTCSIDGVSIFTGGGYTDNSDFNFPVFPGNVVAANCSALTFYPIKEEIDV